MQQTERKSAGSAGIGGITSVAISGDGKWLVTGSLDLTARLWEALNGKEIRGFRGHTDGVTSVALSGDGKWLATGSGDCTGGFGMQQTEKVECPRFRGHINEVTGVALSGDGMWLATGSRASTARLWDVASGKEIRSFKGHTRGKSHQWAQRRCESL